MCETKELSVSLQLFWAIKFIFGLFFLLFKFDKISTLFWSFLPFYDENADFFQFLEENKFIFDGGGPKTEKFKYSLSINKK